MEEVTVYSQRDLRADFVRGSGTSADLKATLHVSREVVHAVNTVGVHDVSAEEQ